MTAAPMHPADLLAVLHSMARDDDGTNRERVPYDGPEPGADWLDGTAADQRALAEENRAERAMRRWER